MGSPDAVARRMMDSGATCTLPDGRTVNIMQLADMVRGKDPAQACRELGVDPSILRGML